jgi:hypothetical protein
MAKQADQDTKYEFIHCGYGTWSYDEPGFPALIRRTGAGAESGSEICWESC